MGKPRIDAALVEEFVGKAHGDPARVTALLEQEPNLVNSCWDWGGGDWETALGAAAHMGRRDIAELLLSKGARIDLFAAAGLEAARLDILSEDFLQRVSALEQKNLAMETLRKLLNDQVRVTERKNLVLSKQFREALEDAMVRYTNKQITTAEMISKHCRPRAQLRWCIRIR